MTNNVEIPNWLKALPLAPTFYPTDTEFADPIAYISKIEKEAGAFGICKVVPPLPKPAKKYVFSNLNKSLLKFPELSPPSASSSTSSTSSVTACSNNGEHSHSRAVFTTRHQELGSTLKKTKPQQQGLVHKQVWQSGEVYTLEQFESKAKSFAREQLGMIKQVTPLVVEALFWKAASQKPIYIEYANDVPGSGFGEPEEISRYFHRRRRRRRRGQYNQNLQESPNNENHDSNISRNSCISSEKRIFVRNDSDSHCQPLNSSAVPSDESTRLKRERSSNDGNDKEGTAGWKLSNSPWNLQVIARSPGSLTRFMLDDIPGVTSPMIYIGMLFSWFAWHVEDHELHSLNFLHTGSSKTWYAVPGDYAFRFEEVIRSKGYGGDLDRLAALTLLGEKTNLLSPKVVTESGLPCCRLVQHPGEFVVTFPRAYHIGFSHGFNCGEAANFGTPQWLKVAKAAAVRRAAMNYLPMLSHQQLLYMLTMSFISSVPRALLPGARTSRLKDRQKEERELLVKKAFTDDMSNEKNMFLALLGKESTSYAVLWDPEALPSLDKGSMPNNTSNVSAMSSGITFVGHQPDHSCIDSTRMPIETLEEFYVDDDDLPCGLHVDTGTLPCVACGVLGFPFMSIVQPSWRASEELFPAECLVTQGLGVSRSIKSRAPSNLYDAVMKSASDSDIHDEHEKVFLTSKARLTDNDIWKVYSDAPFEASETTKLKETPPPLFQSNVDDPAVSCNSQASTSDSCKKWNTSNGFLRPRVFCLEHALEIEELLRSKGGANVLIICHSAYPKIKAHALAVAEEIGALFDSNEIPLQCASKEDMNLITVSIEDDHHEECREDWTSRLGLNLRYCVKLKKLSPSKQGLHALALGGLFSDVFPGLGHLSFNWKSRRSRTPYIKKSIRVEKSVKKPQTRDSFGVDNVIQYSRRRSWNHKVVPPLESHREEDDCTIVENEGTSDVCENASKSRSPAAEIREVKEVEILEAPLKDPIIDKEYEGDTSGEQHKNPIDEDHEVSNLSGSMESPDEETPQPVKSAVQVFEEMLEPNGKEMIPKPNKESKEVFEEMPEPSEGATKVFEEMPEPTKKEKSKRRRELDMIKEDETSYTGYIKSPCEGLRPRNNKIPSSSTPETQRATKKSKRSSSTGELHKCNIEGCRLIFNTVLELNKHKANRCTHQGCGKKFRSHSYAVLHQRVHVDERPLKCSWKGCNMSFKWTWARTEHLRVHTGERPYQCKVEGCGLTFRFVSDFSRHRRKSGHCLEENV